MPSRALRWNIADRFDPSAPPRQGWTSASCFRGEYPKERPLTPQDLLATICYHLGVGRDHEFRDFGGRPVPVLAGGQAIRELI
jgi:hypothetical protein